MKIEPRYIPALEREIPYLVGTDAQDNFEIIDDTEYNSLIELNEFNSFFMNLHGNHYHPNELSAELMSIYYLKIMKLSHKKFGNTAYSNMVIWLKEVLD